MKQKYLYYFNDEISEDTIAALQESLRNLKINKDKHEYWIQFASDGGSLDHIEFLYTLLKNNFHYVIGGPNLHSAGFVLWLMWERKNRYILNNIFASIHQAKTSFSDTSKLFSKKELKFYIRELEGLDYFVTNLLAENLKEYFNSNLSEEKKNYFKLNTEYGTIREGLYSFAESHLSKEKHYNMTDLLHYKLCTNFMLTNKQLSEFKVL